MKYIPRKAESLVDHLEFQLSLHPISVELAEIADFIIGNIDGDGRLKILNEDIASEMSCSLERVETRSFRSARAMRETHGAMLPTPATD